jgi:hypothetical protein
LESENTEDLSEDSSISSLLKAEKNPVDKPKKLENSDKNKTGLSKEMTINTVDAFTLANIAEV